MMWIDKPPLTRADFRRKLQDGLNAQFGMEYHRYPTDYREILGPPPPPEPWYRKYLDWFKEFPR
jgi:hypothetical protein